METDSRSNGLDTSARQADTLTANRLPVCSQKLLSDVLTTTGAVSQFTWQAFWRRHRWRRACSPWQPLHSILLKWWGNPRHL